MDQAAELGMATYPFHEAASGRVEAPPQDLFDRLDDPQNLSMHMEEPSIAMLGARMRLSTDPLGGHCVGSVIRMEGRVLGIPLWLEEAITERDPPHFKTWESRGEPRLIVIGPYRMAFHIAADRRGSQLTISIDYRWPAGAWGGLLGRLFARSYAKWCCARMLRDAQAAFAACAPPEAST